MATTMTSLLRTSARTAMSPYRIFLRLNLLKWMPTSKLRVWYLRKLGARIGTNNRIHSVDFLNAEFGFSRLTIADDCYIGPGVLLDLAGNVKIGRGTAISARAVILSHDDPGSSHHSPLCKYFPPAHLNTHIGNYCWIGAGAIVLGGTSVGEQCVLGAGSVAKGSLEPMSVYAGQPATLRRKLSEKSIEDC